MRNRLLPLCAVTFFIAAGCTPRATDVDTGSGSGGNSNTGGRTSSGGGGSSSPGTGGSTAGSTGGSSSGGSSGDGGSGGGTSGTGGSSDTGGSGAGGTADPGTGGTVGGGTDGGGTDTPMAGGGSGCTGVTSKFCSDFEQQTAGGAPNGNGDFAVTGAGITVDGAKGFSGTKSLHFKPTGATAQLKFTKQFPFTEQYGRMMMWMAKTPTTGSHWDIVESDSAAKNQWAWGGQAKVFELVVDPPDDGIDSKTPFPDGAWVCIQWKFSAGTGGKSEYTVKTNGTPVNPGPVIGRWKAGAWNDLMVGWAVFGSAPGTEFWIDDLAFGETEIACPTK